MFEPEDDSGSDEPYIPGLATITVTYHSGESASVKTSDLMLIPESKTPDPDQVGIRYKYISENLDLPGNPVIHLDVIQDFQGGCRYINEDIYHSVTIEVEAPSDWYSVEIGD